MSLVHDIVTRIDEIDRIPEAVERSACLHILDAVGVGFAAANSIVGKPLARYGEASISPEGPASVFGQPFGASPAQAALINGGLIHSLEFDDTHTGSIAHGSAVLVATAIALGEAQSRTSREVDGKGILKFYVLWYEILIRIGLSAPGGFQNQGFQLTSVGGAICAAGLAANMRGFDRDKSVAAIGISLSQASGVFEFLSNGATVKSIHPGWAAHAGIIASDLAAFGVTGPHTAMEGRFGLFRVFAGDSKAAERFSSSLDDLGRVWHLQDVAFKFLPCCHYLHAFIEAAASLMNEGITSKQIHEISFEVPAGAASIICEPWEAKCATTGHAARWSLPVAVAMQIIDGSVCLDSFERPISPGVLSLARRSKWSQMVGSGFPTHFDAVTSFRLTDGTELQHRIDDVYGSSFRPASKASIESKFTENMMRSTGKIEADRLRCVIYELSELPNVTDLTEALRAASKRE